MKTILSVLAILFLFAAPAAAWPRARVVRQRAAVRVQKVVVKEVPVQKVVVRERAARLRLVLPFVPVIPIQAAIVQPANVAVEVEKGCCK